MKNVLLIQNAASSMGGVETLIARIAQRLIEENQEVTILILGNSARSRVLHLLPDGCRVVFFPGLLYSRVFYPRGYWHRQWRDVLPNDCDLIMCFSPAGIAAMRFFRKAWFVNAKEVVYVVHPKMLASGFSEVPSYLGRIIDSLPGRAFLFMNEACRSGNQGRFSKEKLEQTRILPLPVDPFARQSLQFESPRRIVSIGRIESAMKTYNWSFIDDFCDLAQRHDLVWEIYGHGAAQDVDSLAKAVQASPCRDRIRLCGEIPQLRIPEVLSGAVAFLGMGTALAQAASCGIPSIVAIGYRERPESYGWFHELPFPSVGEDLGKSIPVRTISSVLEELLSMDPAEVMEIGDRCRKHALQFSSDRFINSVFQYCVDQDDFPAISRAEILAFWFAYIVWRLKSKFKFIFVKRIKLKS
jgi:glycosyltransferase involved in cell wall biosynthesis